MEEFSNDNVDVKLDRKGGCQLEVEVRIKPAGCKKSYEEAYKDVRKHVSIPGFRKGKAPEAVIKKNFADAIERQWKDSAMNFALRQMLELTKLYPWSREGIPTPNMSEITEEGATVEFKYESEPNIPDVKPEELKIEKVEPAEVTDAMVKEEIDERRKQFSSYKAIEGRGIEAGDFVNLDIENIDEDPPVKLVDDRQAEVAEGKLAPWLYALLLGKKAGDVAEAKSEADPDADEETKKNFEPINCRVTIKKHEEQVPADDKTLLENLKMDSLEDLQEAARKRLGEQEKDKAQNETRQKLWKQIIENHPFEVPASLAADEQQRIVHQEVYALRQQGASEEKILEKEKEIGGWAAQEAVKELQILFLSRELATKSGKAPTEKEVEQRLTELMMWDALSRGQMPNMQDWASRNPQEVAHYRNKAYILLMRERAENYLLGE